MKYLLLSLIFITSSIGSAAEYAESINTCREQLAVNVQSKTAELEKLYSDVLKERFIFHPSNSPQLLKGHRTDKAILVIHGFTATPFEVTDLAKHLNEQGYTVYVPVTTAFGSTSSEISNKLSSIETWQSSLRSSVETLSKCYPKITMIGFSLGGGMVADYLSQNKIASQELVDSAVFISPYIAPYLNSGDFVVDLLKFFGIEGVPIALINNLTLRQIDDLKAPAKFKENYNSKLPVLATEVILDYARLIQSLPKDVFINIPTMLAYSESDRTVNVELARSYFASHFKLDFTYIYTEKVKIPHHIPIIQMNPASSDVFKEISNFIK